MKFTTTSQMSRARGIKFLVYGRAGVGKTFLIRTLPRPLIVSAEDGLLSLQDYDFKVIVVETFGDLLQVMRDLPNKGAKFDSVAFDSVTELAAIVLRDVKRRVKDGRMAYGEMQEWMTNWFTALKQLEKHVLLIAGETQVRDEVAGRIYHAPMFPGRNLAGLSTYIVDEVFRLCISEDEEEDGVTSRYLLTQPDETSEAKDRSGRLDRHEPADLSQVIAKITQAKK